MSHSKKHARDVARFRADTTLMMGCRTCGGRMLIGDAGLVCEGGCGGIVEILVDYKKLVEAWPDRKLKQKAAKTGMGKRPRGDKRSGMLFDKTAQDDGHERDV